MMKTHYFARTAITCLLFLFLLPYSSIAQNGDDSNSCPSPEVIEVTIDGDGFLISWSPVNGAIGYKLVAFINGVLTYTTTTTSTSFFAPFSLFGGASDITFGVAAIFPECVSDFIDTDITIIATVDIVFGPKFLCDGMGNLVGTVNGGNVEYVDYQTGQLLTVTENCFCSAVESIHSLYFGSMGMYPSLTCPVPDPALYSDFSDYLLEWHHSGCLLEILGEYCTGNNGFGITYDGDFGFSETSLKTSLEVSPNPIFETANVQLDIESGGKVKLQIFDLYGRIVVDFPEETLPAGRHTKTINGSQLDPGVYFVIMESNGEIFNQRIIKME